eukprot:scaffold16771_cov99-Cylindrotheca_fusiformis.AAC.2
MDPISAQRRLQEDKDVSLVANSAGQCQISTLLQTPSSSSPDVATGVMFSVTAKQDIEITAFEFDHFKSEVDLHVKIYTLQGSDYLSNRNQPGAWTFVNESTGVESPDDGDEEIMIAPRADIKVPLIVNAGQSRSFYFSLRSQHLKLDKSSLATGQPYASDSMLQTNVGIGIRQGNFPNSNDDFNRAFLGRIHYQSIESCSNFPSQTVSVIRVAVNPTAIPQSPNNVFRSAFSQLLDGQANWVRWKENQGLQLSNFVAATVETKEDCREYGFTNGCVVFDNTLSFSHYQSLSSKDVQLEVIRSIGDTNDAVSFNGQSKMIYIGPKAVSRYYKMELVGITAGTILNPLQRDYIGSVTLDFLDTYSDEKPNAVDVVGQDLSRRMQESDLRGGRQLQVGVVTAESFIYGITDDPTAFFDAIEEAFRARAKDYRTQLEVEQYRPGPINAEGDFGSVFTNLIKVSVKTNETSSGGSSAGETEDNTWLIICSVGIALSLLFLMYRFCKDCLLVKDGAKIDKSQTLSARKESMEIDEDPNRPSNYYYGWRNSDKRAKEAPKNKANEAPKNKANEAPKNKANRRKGSGGSSPRVDSGKGSKRDRANNRGPNSNNRNNGHRSRSPKPQRKNHSSEPKRKPSSSRSEQGQRRPASASSQNSRPRPPSGSSMGKKSPRPPPPPPPKQQQRRQRS